MENLQYASAHDALRAFMKIRTFECCHSYMWMQVESHFLYCYKQLDFWHYRETAAQNQKIFWNICAEASTPEQILNAMLLHRGIIDVGFQLEIMDRITLRLESQLCIILDHITQEKNQ